MTRYDIGKYVRHFAERRMSFSLSCSISLFTRFSARERKQIVHRILGDRRCCTDTLDVQLQATLMSKFPGSIRGISITCRCHCGTNRMKFFPPVFAVVRIMKCDVYEIGRDVETLAFCNSLTRPSQAHPALVLRHTLARFGCTIVERCKGKLRCTVKTNWCLE